MIRLNKFIAENSSVSRREADRLIDAKKVRVNGKPAEKGLQIDPYKDEVKIDGNAIKPRRESLYFAFYKPKGVLTSYEEHKEKKSLSAFPYLRKNKVAYSGRLDFNSEGLIIFSSDGEVIQRMQKSHYGLEKEYFVYVDSNLTGGELAQFTGGLETEEGEYQPCKAERVDDKVYRVVLTEGKNRQIRNMFKHFGVRVKKLVRARIGNIMLGRMKPGEYRKLESEEILELKKCIGLK